MTIVVDSSTVFVLMSIPFLLWFVLGCSFPSQIGDVFDCLLLTPVPIPFVRAYYSNLLISRRAPELIFCIEISKFCVCNITAFPRSALFGGVVGFSVEFTDVEHIAAPGVLLSLPWAVHRFMQSVGCFVSCLIALSVL